MENSTGLMTAPNPVLGYEKSVAVAKEALQTGHCFYELTLEKDRLSKETLVDMLSPVHRARNLQVQELRKN